MYKCVFIPQGAQCERRECHKCGHNPEVAKARLEKIKAKLEGRDTDESDT